MYFFIQIPFFVEHICRTLLLILCFQFQLSSVERYSPRIGRWEMVDSLPKGLSASMCAVVVNLPVRLMDNYRELAQSNVC